MPIVETLPIKLEPVASQVADILRQWILTGHLAGGQHVRQEAIAEELGVSRVPVREALLEYAEIRLQRDLPKLDRARLGQSSY